MLVGTSGTKGAGIRYHNTSQIQILLASHFHDLEKKGRGVRFEIDRPTCRPGLWNASGLPSPRGPVLMGEYILDINIINFNIILIFWLPRGP